MKWINDSKIRLILIGVIVIFMTFGDFAEADFTFGEPVNLGPTFNSSSHEADTYISSDGLEFYFSSDRSGGFGHYDLYVSTRTSIEDDWTEPVNLGQIVNSESFDGGPCISADGLELYFESRRPGGLSSVSDIWVSRRATIDAPWSVPVNLGPPINSQGADVVPSISVDGLQLYFASSRDGGYGMFDIYVSTRQTKDDDWSIPVNLGPVVNSAAYQWFPHVSGDGRTLFFARGYPEEIADLWMTRRKTIDDDWGEPVKLESIATEAKGDGGPYLSSDESILYFYSTRPGGYGGWDLWLAPIIPIVDFNGDGFLDIDDLVILIENWGTDETLCDIGPTPLGDGIVDIQYLSVFMEHFKGIPSAESGEVHVDEDDASGQVELNQGQVLVVTLESNPSTGYRWEVIEDPESILEQLGEPEYKSSGEPVVGAGGWEIFRFKAISEGRISLRLIYHRPWEEDVEPIKTFSIDVTVN